MAHLPLVALSTPSLRPGVPMRLNTDWSDRATCLANQTLTNVGPRSVLREIDKLSLGIVSAAARDAVKADRNEAPFNPQSRPAGLIPLTPIPGCLRVRIVPRDVRIATGMARNGCNPRKRTGAWWTIIRSSKPKSTSSEIPQLRSN